MLLVYSSFKNNNTSSLTLFDLHYTSLEISVSTDLLQHTKSILFAIKKEKTPHTLSEGGDACRAIFAHFFPFFVCFAKGTEKGDRQHKCLAVSLE